MPESEQARELGLLRLMAALVSLGGPAVIFAACGRGDPESRPSLAAIEDGFAPRLVPQASGTSALLQAVSVVDERTVWVSGHQGTWARTLDGGATWRTGRVPGADTLQFRDVHAANADTAWLMSAGTGTMSRIFRTTDGGATWRQQHVAEDPDAFYDCMDFWDSRTGLVFGDAIGDRLALMTTVDGERWTRVPADRLPRALTGEGSFAASGRCIAVAGTRHAWIGMGNTTETRVLMTRDRGLSWEAVRTPIVGGEGNGLTTVAFRDTLNGVALGGTIGAPDAFSDNVAVTSDGGRSWTLGARPPHAGALYGGVYVPGSRAVVAVGPRGMVWSADEARTWTMLDTLSYWSIGFASAGAGWAVGPRGRITRIEMR